VAGSGIVLLDWGPTRGDPNPLRARLVNVYTAPAYRRRGLARALIQTALDEAARLRIGTATLGASAQASALYLELGFQVSGNEMVLRLPKPV
jgi:GNAT superfamily N-acetyltransferase